MIDVKAVGIPTRLPREISIDKTVSHPLMARYDHSLERVRKKFGQPGMEDDGIEMGNMTSSDVLDSSPE